MESHDPEYERLIAEEKLILEATELISSLMETRDVSRAQLADRIGKSRAYMTQVLAGNRNMTLRTLADLAWALGTKVQLAVPELMSPEVNVADKVTTAAMWTRGSGHVVGINVGGFTGTGAVKGGASAVVSATAYGPLGSPPWPGVGQWPVPVGQLVAGWMKATLDSSRTHPQQAGGKPRLRIAEPAA